MRICTHDQVKRHAAHLRAQVAVALLAGVLCGPAPVAAEAGDFHDLSPAERSQWLNQLGRVLDHPKPALDAPAGHDTVVPRIASSSQGPISWQVDGDGLVALADGRRPMGSRIFARSCFEQYSDSFRRWASAYSVDLNIAHLVATAITESGCSQVAGLGSVDDKSTGIMQVTGYTCVSLLKKYGGRKMTERECMEKMAMEPDFSVELGAGYIAQPSQIKLTALDPPKVAAAYNAGGVYFDRRNPWGMRCTGNHIDRFVAAYNSYVAFQKDERAGRRSRSPAVRLTRGASLPKAVASPADLPALAPIAREGETVFVGDWDTRSGDFYVFVGGEWRGSMEDSEKEQ